MEKKKKKRGIFLTLIGSYVTFSILLILTLILTVLVAVGMLIRGSSATIDPYLAIHDVDSILYKTGGWAETLDHELRVTSVQGKKQDNIWQYSFPDLLNVPYANAENDFKLFIQKSENGYELFKLPYNQLSVEYTYNIPTSVPQANNLNIIVPVMFVTLFILDCILLSLYLKRKISKPLEALEKGMLSVSTGDDRVFVSSRGPREFIEIQDSFNRMISRLNESEKSRKEIETSRTQMLLNLSHDIKTPISTMKLYSKALCDGLVTGKKAEDYLYTIDAKAGRVNEMLEDLFISLKMENTAFQISRERCDIGELVREICTEYYDDIQSADLTLNLDIPEETLPVDADRKLLQRAISNLLSNAIKYNRSGSNIFICVKHFDKVHAEISIVDDGEAISAETVKTLFDAFSRGDAARSSTGGSGLGLSITKGIAEKHGGTLTYRYEGDRNMFIFRI